MVRCWPWAHDFQVVSDTMTSAERDVRYAHGLSCYPSDYSTYVEEDGDGGLVIYALVCARCGKRRAVGNKPAPQDALDQATGEGRR